MSMTWGKDTGRTAPHIAEIVTAVVAIGWLIAVFAAMVMWPRVKGIGAMKHTPNYDHSGYMKYFLNINILREKAALATKVLRRFDFDAIAFRGMSGALIAPVLALRLSKTLLMVRKPETICHSERAVEGDRGARTYIIVDDFICSGATATAIYEAVKVFAPKAQCLGVLQIRDLEYDDVLPNLLDDWQPPIEQKQVIPPSETTPLLSSTEWFTSDTRKLLDRLGEMPI